MSIDERLRDAAHDIAETHRLRPIPTRRKERAVPRLVGVLAAAALVTASFAVLALRNDTPLEDVASPSTASTIPRTTAVSPTTTADTSPEPTTPTTLQMSELAWTEAEAEAMVEGYLAALADGQWDIAAASMDGAGMLVETETGEMLPADWFAERCGETNCDGPYRVEADGPGLVDPQTITGSSTVTVTHVPSGRSSTITIRTFEGQPVIEGLPPQLPSDQAVSTEVALFGSDLPIWIVQERFGAVEILKDGESAWHIQPFVDRFSFALDRDWALMWVPGPFTNWAVRVDDPTTSFEVGECAGLLGRGVTTNASPCIAVTEDGDMIEVPAATASGEGNFEFLVERSGVRAIAAGDAEGNLTDMRTSTGVDLIGDDYISIPRLSPDGSLLAYVDHSDSRAVSHFWSPVVVVRDTRTGDEIARVEFGQPIAWLEFDGRWIVVGEWDGNVNAGNHATVASHDLATGETRTVDSRLRIWLP